MTLKDGWTLIGVFATVAGVVNALVWAIINHKNDRKISKRVDRQTDVKIEAAQVQMANDLTEMMQRQHAQDKEVWQADRTHLRERVGRLEKQRDLDIISATAHRDWDTQAHQLALELDSDFPPPPPIFHGEPKVTINAELKDAQLTLEYNDDGGRAS